MRVAEAHAIHLHGPDAETTCFLSNATFMRWFSANRREGRKIEFGLDMGCVRMGQTHVSPRWKIIKKIFSY
jgi:hypothetical protein